MESALTLEETITEYVKLLGTYSDKNSRINSWLSRRVANKKLLIEATPGEELFPNPEEGILFFRVRILEKCKDGNKITRIKFYKDKIGNLLNKVVVYRGVHWIITWHSDLKLKLYPI